MDVRARAVSSMVRSGSFGACQVRCFAMYGPAATAVRYVGSSGVGWKRTVWVSAAESCATAGCSAGGWFDSTVHSPGAVTVNSKGAFRSGWSKHGKMRRASDGSRWEYR